MRKQLLSVLTLAAIAATVIGWLLARHFVRSGHPYVGVLVIGIGIGPLLVPILRGARRR
jgi:hypothetical protein